MLECEWLLVSLWLCNELPLQVLKMDGWMGDNMDVNADAKTLSECHRNSWVFFFFFNARFLFCSTDPSLITAPVHFI